MGGDEVVDSIWLVFGLGSFDFGGKFRASDVDASRITTIMRFSGLGLRFRAWSLGFKGFWYRMA